MKTTHILADFLAEVVLTSHYIAEPVSHTTEDLHDAEMRCLKVVFAFQPIEMHSIAEMMHCGRPRASQLVQQLEAKQLVCRTSGDDHRVSIISTTAAGARTVEELRQKYRDLAEVIEQKLGHEKTAQLSRLLSEIVPLATLK